MRVQLKAGGQHVEISRDDGRQWENFNSLNGHFEELIIELSTTCDTGR